MGLAQTASEQLRRALRELAEADVPDLIEHARQRARTRAEKLIEDALLDELLAAAGQMRTRSTEAADTTRQHEADNTAWWTYCVLAARDAPMIPTRLEGVEPGSVVEVLHDGELAALVSAVPAAEYDDVRLREHLEDLEWVERTARRHEAVLEEALGHITIVPLRLCTIYHDQGGVRGLLREHADTLLRSLARVEGCAEWGVKVFADGSATGTYAQTAVEEADALTERPGATYLIQRRRERQRAEQASELRGRCVESVHQTISACARESISNPPQRPELHGREMAMLLNGAYLVALERTSELHDAINALQAEWEPRGFVLELTGPWPAYNFVSGATGVMP